MADLTQGKGEDNAVKDVMGNEILVFHINARPGVRPWEHTQTH